jgi:RimJ/RimL family protein N-acetyltransferase
MPAYKQGAGIFKAWRRRGKERVVEIMIREAKREDVHGIISYMTTLSNEPGLYIGFEPGEFNATVEGEISWIENHAKADNSIILLAVSTDSASEKWDLEDGEMVGLMNCWGGSRRATRHETTLGITVKANWRGQGIGTRLMQQAIEWARGTGVVKRVQLEVVAENVEARELYERLGFVAEGVRKKAFWKRERWMDSVVMGMLL